MWIIVTHKKKKYEWKPDRKYSELLRRYFELGLSAHAASVQTPPTGNKWGITKMPHVKTVRKYWNFWKEELAKDDVKKLADNQREVKGLFEIMYDKRIMVAEDLLQELLAYREQTTRQYINEQKKLGVKIIPPKKPEMDVVAEISHLNEVLGKFQLNKAAMQAAPVVSQLSEEAVIVELEEEMDNIAKKVRKTKREKNADNK